ncbi:MAG: NTP transferase domain-containing protein [Desulfovibrionaceae bacterium]
MRIGCLVQARMNSSRLPGKVTGDLCGKPLLQYVFERLERVPGLDFHVVATSSGPADEAIREFCVAHGVPCFSGPLDDVALRFVRALQAHPCDGFVRYCADSPLVDVALLSRGVALFREHDVDLVTNVHPRTFPSGQSVEVVRASTFEQAYPRMRGDELEHNTLYFYNNASKFRILNFESGMSRDERCLSVNTDCDHRRLAGMIARMDRPHWQYGWRELLELCGCTEAEA